ncbi:hypothetical protein M3Y99_01208200 [Aphelenchoides fujianensis]|nr:hypothetical protein M3Y99_01208200 [Aphelenchoides fujianensis]
MNRPLLRVLDVDFTAKNFRIARTFELPLARPVNPNRERVVAAWFGERRELPHPPLVNHAILRTPEPQRFLVVVGDARGPAAFVFDHAMGAVEAVRNGEALTRGLFVALQLLEQQLVCVGRALARWNAPERLAVRVVLVDLETGGERLIPVEQWFFTEVNWRVESTCMRGGCLHVLVKEPGSEEAIRVFALRLPEGFWKELECGQFGAFSFDQTISAFQAGVWTVHCRRTPTFGDFAAWEFHSFRIPMTCPESLLWRSWFSLLGRPNIRVDVPGGFLFRLLSPTGLFTNRVAFLHQQTVVIREDLDSAGQPSAAVIQAGFPRRGDAEEQAALEAAIERSLLMSTDEAAEGSAEKKAELSDEDVDHQLEAYDLDSEATDA